MFPLVSFASSLLGMLALNATSISNTLLTVRPDDVVYSLEAYLYDVTDKSRPVMFWFLLVFTVRFPMRAVKGLVDGARLAYQL